MKPFIDQLSALGAGEPDAAQLRALGRVMTQLPLDRTAYRAAAPGEELVYVLHEAGDGPALYLVSDGAGVQSAPHEHQTWAVIAGLAGNELNVLYQLAEPGRRVVRPVSQSPVRAGEFIGLPSGAIHATLAADAQPTYHLHLYGRPLRLLAPYASRCYVADHTP